MILPGIILKQSDFKGCYDEVCTGEKKKSKSQKNATFVVNFYWTQRFVSVSDQSGVAFTDGFPSLKTKGALPGQDVLNVSVDQYLSGQN